MEKNKYTQSMTELLSDPRDQHTQRNIFAFGSVEFFWGIGLPVIIDSTFLQLFLRNLGADSIIIGFIPAMFFLGPAVFGPVSGYMTAHLERKRIPVLLFHLFPSTVWLIFGFYYLPTGNTPATIAVFLGAYTLFTVGMGLMLPIWQNYLGRVFSPEKSVAAIAVIMTAQTVAKILGSFLILKTVEQYSFDSRAAAVIFLGIGGVFTLGAFFFLFTREDATGSAAVLQKTGFRFHLRRSFGEALRNRNFLFYLGGNLEFFTVVAVLSFYANYAVEYRGIKPAAAAGLFVMVNYAMHLGMNILFGWKGYLSLKHKCLVSHFFSFIGVTVLITRPELPGFLVAGALLGSARAIRNLVYVPIIRKVSGKDDATDYFTTAPIITLPVSASLSLAGGKLLDLLQPLGELSYTFFFGFALLMILISGFFISRGEF